jgi:CHAD domain-containing protein
VTWHGRRSAHFLGLTLRALDRQLGESLPRVTSRSDPEAVHDMRVAIRRARTLLRLARPIYGRFLADAVRLSFARVQHATGDLRDEEALFELFAQLDVADPAFAAWQKRRGQRDRALRDELVSRIRAGALRRPRALLHALVILPVPAADNAPLAKLARRSVARACKEVESKRDVATSDVVGLHDLRIAYKKLRYAAEFFAEALPPELAALAPTAARFQKRLGEIHDVDVAIETIRRARGMPPATRSNVLAALGAWRDKRVAKYQGELAPAQRVQQAPAARNAAEATP